MLDQLKQLVLKHWGHPTFRPLQEDAMRAVLEGRDSLLVLPTGGGKSLCYQAPAVLRGGTTVVVSPLISLMKDQVDGLRDCGIPAVQLDSSLSPSERFSYEQDVRDGAVRLLFVSPERLLNPDFCNLCRQAQVKTFAVDEAHCISQLARQRMRLDYMRVCGLPSPSGRGAGGEGLDLGNEYRDLLEEYDRGGLPFERVLTRLSYGRWLLTQGDREQARAVNAVGLELCRRFGMSLLELDCQALQAESRGPSEWQQLFPGIDVQAMLARVTIRK